MANYDSTSAYYNTPYSQFFLDVMTNRPFPKEGDDQSLVITFSRERSVDQHIQKELAVGCEIICTSAVVISHYQNPCFTNAPLANCLRLNCWLAWLRVTIGNRLIDISILVGT